SEKALIRTDWCAGGFPASACIHIRMFALTPFIQGRSRMRESRSYGSVRGVAGDRYPFRDPHPYPSVSSFCLPLRSFANLARFARDAFKSQPAPKILARDATCVTLLRITRFFSIFGFFP